MSALSKIKKIFPQVTKVVDAKESIRLSVNESDTKSGRKKDFAECALAKACKRTEKADATIIGLGFSYLIKDNVATRYKTSAGVAREIVSFDRHQDFSPGEDYLLEKIPPSEKLGSIKGGHGRNNEGSKGPRIKKIFHKTAFVRELKKL